MNMPLNEWINHLMMGREIEFHFKEEAFLLSHIPGTEPLLFSIWNGTKNCEICRGTLDCILNFEFDADRCLNTSPDAFSVDYIL